MSKLQLIRGFRNLSVGESQLLRIKKVSFDPKFNKAQVTFEDVNGASQTETFNFNGKKKGEINEVALGIFSTICKCVTHDFTDREIEIESIEGGYIIADVYEQKVDVVDDQGVVTDTKKYIHLRNWKEADSTFPDDEDIDGYL